jgi:hypothetical protein
MEIIKPLPGYEKEYAISNLGNVYSLIFKSRHGTFKRQKLLKPNISKSGYFSFALGSQKDGLMKRYLLHRLVALTFLPNPNNKPIVNHIDGDKSNNAVSNLEWCTVSENEIHAHKTGLKNFSKNHRANACLNQDQVEEIRTIKNLTQRSIAKKYNTTQANISRIINNKTWR